MGWLTDLLGDLFNLLLTEYRLELLQILVLLLLFMSRSKVKEIGDGMKGYFKDRAFIIVLFAISAVLFMTIDDPLFNMSLLFQVVLASILLVIALHSQIKKQAVNIYNKKIKV